MTEMTIDNIDADSIFMPSNEAEYYDHPAREIGVDWDIKYDSFRGPNTILWKVFNEWKQEIANRYGTYVLWHRRSSRNMTHLLLVFDHDIPPLDNLMIRAILGDDYRRPVLDLKRMFKYGVYEINRLFDWKVLFDNETGEIKTYQTGEWRIGEVVNQEKK